jgi:hypothetical protein
MPREERIRMVNEYMEFTSVGQFFKATELAHLSEKKGGKVVVERDLFDLVAKGDEGGLHQGLSMDRCGS